MAEKSIRSENTDELFKAVLSLKSVEDCYAFFEDLCTVKELSSMVQRYEVARLLHKGKTFTTISEQTGASPATITRVNRCLQYGDGYIKTLAEGE